jgi:hypothetical protein
MRTSLLAIAALLLSGCVSFPIPPYGPDLGKLGSLQLKMIYVPNVAGTITYLFSKQQQQPKPTSTK